MRVTISAPVVVAVVGSLLACPARSPSSSPSEAAPPASPAERAEPPAVWLGLEPGPHAVGYRQELRFDPARSYDNALVPLGRRPILINRWYPAGPGGEAMTVGDYLEVPAADEASARFAELLEHHAGMVMASESLDGRPLAFATAAQREALAAMQAEPVFARRDAEALVGAWPVVVYHPGLGGAFADNFVLFELLASHGYLVVSSAYMPNDLATFAIEWDPPTSIADFDYVIRTLAESGELDEDTKLAVMGHSYGGQAALIYAMEGRRVDAVVSIDSSIEVGDPEDPWYRRGRAAQWLDRGDALTVPSLLLAQERASVTSFFDSLTGSDRRAVFVPHLDHDDFVSHGILLTLHAHALRDAQAPASAYVAAHAWELRTIHAFLDGTLAGDAARLAALTPEWAASLDGARLVHAAAEDALDFAYFAALYEAEGVAGIVAECEPPGEAPRCPTAWVLIGLGQALAENTEVERGVAILREVVERHGDMVEAHDALGVALLLAGEPEAAVAAFERALELATAGGDEEQVAWIGGRLAWARELGGP